MSQTSIHLTEVPSAEAPRNRRERRASMSPKAARRWVNVAEVADHLGISIPSVWRGVAAGPDRRLSDARHLRCAA